MSKLSVNLLAFEGFYESEWDDALDHQDELFIENEIDQDPDLDAAMINEALYDARNYHTQMVETAKLYVETFNTVCKEDYGLDLKLTYETVESPREYNFTTDKIYAEITASTARRLFKLSEKEGHTRLRALIAHDYEPRDGFWPNYSNQLSVWLAKPVIQWDHNELGSLLAALLMTDEEDYRLDEFRQAVFARALDVSCGLSGEWEAGYDWDKYETAKAKLKEAHANCD